ncbi:hypothetical protein [Archangium lansingense]|uniref:Uncharacterized protein n=1 Tax=Archangium lansingense TaxID=2995310 RepID=A0ABT4A3D4_9BACT|nr:hypothetical protein [Archangium lansinium]MCY1076154.1 hypothetical protein [Archangium lansinium]
MGNQPEIVRLRVLSKGEDLREVSAWRIGPGIYLTATSPLLGPQPGDTRRVVVQGAGQPKQVLVVESDDESNLTLLAPEVDGARDGAGAGSAALKVEVLDASGDTEDAWPLLADEPADISNCAVLLSSAHERQRVLGRLTLKGDSLEVITSPDSPVETRELLGCPVLHGGKVVGLVTQRTRTEGMVLAVTASTILSLWRRRCEAGPQDWRQRSFVYGTIKLFMAAVGDPGAWTRELASVDPRLKPGFGAYQLSLAQSQQTPLLLFLLRCLLGPLVTVLLFDLSLAGALLYNPGLFSTGLLNILSQQLVMSFCLAIVGALGLSVLTGVGAAVGAATVGGLAGGVAVLLTLPILESTWSVAGITAGSMCGTACGVLWMQRAEVRRKPTRGQLLAVGWGVLEGLVLFVALGLIGLEFTGARLSWGGEREKAMGAVLGLLLVAPGLLAFFLRRREAPGQWFGTVLFGMAAVFASLGVILHPILVNRQPESLMFGAAAGVLTGIGLCGTFSLMHALAENFGAGPWSDAAPLLGTCLLLPLVFLSFAGTEGVSLARLGGCLLSSGLLSFVLMIARQWVPVPARYVGAGQRRSGVGVEPGP